MTNTLFRTFCIALFGAALSLPLAAPLAAQSEATKGVSLRNSIGAALNPTGASLSTHIYYTEPLYDYPEGRLWESARTEIGLSNTFSPAYDDISLNVFIEPIAVFDLRSKLGVRYAYDLLGYGFTPVSSYDKQYKSAGELPSETRVGFFMELTPRFKFALGPLFFVNAFSWNIYSFYYGESSESSPYYYEPTHDVILHEKDSLYKNTVTVLYSLPLGSSAELLAGLTHDILYVDGSEYRSQKLSLLGIAQLPFPQYGLTVDAALLLGGFLENRYYAMEEGYFSPALQVGLTRKF